MSAAATTGWFLPGHTTIAMGGIARSADASSDSLDPFLFDLCAVGFRTSRFPLGARTPEENIVRLQVTIVFPTHTRFAAGTPNSIPALQIETGVEPKLSR